MMQDALKDFFDLPAELMSAIGTVLGFAMIGDLTSTQMNSLGGFLMLIGQVLQTTAGQRQVREEAVQNRQIDEMQAAIRQLQQQLGLEIQGFTPTPPPPK